MSEVQALQLKIASMERERDKVSFRVHCLQRSLSWVQMDATVTTSSQMQSLQLKIAELEKEKLMQTSYERQSSGSNKRKRVEQSNSSSLSS